MMTTQPAVALPSRPAPPLVAKLSLRPPPAPLSAPVAAPVSAPTRAAAPAPARVATRSFDRTRAALLLACASIPAVVLGGRPLATMGSLLGIVRGAIASDRG